MPIPRRAMCLILAVVAISFSIAPKGGLYTPLSVIFAAIAVGLTTWICVTRDQPWKIDSGLIERFPLYASILLVVQAFFLTFVYDQTHERFSSFPRSWECLDPTAGLVWLVAIVLTISLFRFRYSSTDPMQSVIVAASILLSGYSTLLAVYLFGPDKANRTLLLTVTSFIGFLANYSWLLDRVPMMNRWYWPRIVLLFVAGAGFRIGAVVASPNPVIDVFTLLDQGSAKLLVGENPYATDYVSPYDTEFAREPRPAGYPAQPYLMAVPFKAIALDVRFANVICDLLAAAAIIAVARRIDRGWWGGVAAGMYLFLPRAPFIMEQAWYEPMMAAAIGWGIYFLVRGSKLGFILIGLGLTAKQFGVPMLIPIVVAYRQSVVWIIIGLAVAAMLSLPFIVWDAHAFFDTVLFKHIGHAPRLDSITLWAFAYHQFGLIIPGWKLMLVAGILILYVSYKTPTDQPATLPLSVGTSLILFCFFHTKGFFNYYYLGQYLFLLALPSLLRPTGEKTANHSAITYNSPITH